MHEVVICEALLGQLATLAEEHGWTRLQRVRVRLGLLCGVVPDALEFAFSVLSVGTPAAGAELVLESEPGHFGCAECGELELASLDFACPQCGGPLQLRRAGRGLYLAGIDPILP